MLAQRLLARNSRVSQASSRGLQQHHSQVSPRPSVQDRILLLPMRRCPPGPMASPRQLSPAPPSRRRALCPPLVDLSRAPSTMDGTKRMVGLLSTKTAKRPLTDRLIETPGTVYSSPSRKAKKQVSYAESDDEDEGPILKRSSGNGRAAKRRRVTVSDDSDDEFGPDPFEEISMPPLFGLVLFLQRVH